ncbi:MAG: T9SS type A sorting domain-containing protein, partial [Bacteroidota bacterium]|nr:T9SS type A sorting domain-containing protein [Bacteroidota bacterium]
GTCGTVISDIANLIVGTPTQITQHPTAETVCEGILKTTGVTAVGTNLTYEWNNGETTSSQTTSLPGAYLVTVTGTCGTAVSNIGLTIQANNKIVQQQTDKKICTGEVAMLQFVADGANMGYNWSNGATTSGIAVSTTGTFMVTVTGTCGVAAVSKPFNVTATPCGGFTAVERWYPVGSVGISAGSAHYQSLEISPSGAPYVAYQDGANGNKTTVLSFNGSNWGAVGSVGISTKSSACQSLAISPSGVPYVAYAEVLITTFITGFKTTVLSFNGSNWGAVGGVGTSEGYLTYQSLAISPSGVPYVAYQDDVNGFKTTVLSFNGSNWGAVGSVGINAGSAEYQSLAISPSGVSYVAHQDYINGFKTTVLSFNGSYWGAVGSAGISSGRAESQSLAISPSGVPYVAYQDDANRSKTTVLSFNGSNWGAVGSVGISAGPTQYQSLAISPSGVPYVAYQDDANGGKTTVLSFNGSNWGAVGSAGISSGRAQSQSLAFSPTGVPYVAYSDGAFGRKTTVLRYGLPPIFEKKATFEITIPKTFSGIATITWPTIAGANTYCIRISTSSNFTTGVKTVCGLTGNSYVYDLSNPNGRTEAATETYYYQVLGVDEEGYYSQWSDAQTFVVDNASTNLPKSESKNLATSVSIYPNPATTELNVTAPANSTLVIYNYLGSVVLSKTLQTTETQLDISSLSNGVYVVKVGDKVVKMIKQ